MRVDRETCGIPCKAYAKSAESLIDYKGSKLRPERTAMDFRLLQTRITSHDRVVQISSREDVLSFFRFAVVWLPKTADPKKDAHLSMSRAELCSASSGAVLSTVELRGPLKDPEAKKLDTCRRQVQLPGTGSEASSLCCSKLQDFAGSWTDTGLAKWIKTLGKNSPREGREGLTSASLCRLLLSRLRQSTYALVDASFAASKYSTEVVARRS